MTIQERNDFITAQLNAGVSLSDVQKALANEHDIRMTYLDLRLLAAELQVDWEKQVKKAKTAPTAAATAPSSPSAASPADAAEADSYPGEASDDAESEAEIMPEEENEADETAEPRQVDTHTTVTISKLVKPGTSLNGSVTFASGAHGDWYVDSYGRLGLDLAEGSAKPNKNDIALFQLELQKQLGY